MRASLLIVTAFGAATIATTEASAQQMYRWVDLQGKIHYTQNPPPRDAAKSVETKRLNTGGPAEGAEQMPFSVRQAVQNFPVTLFTAPDCPRGCSEARALLAKRGVPYREISVTDSTSKDSLQKLTGDSQVPSMLVGRSVEKGYEEGAFNDALDSAGYPRTSLFVGKPPALPSPKPQAKPAPAPDVLPQAPEGTPEPPQPAPAG